MSVCVCRHLVWLMKMCHVCYEQQAGNLRAVPLTGVSGCAWGHSGGGRDVVDEKASSDWWKSVMSREGEGLWCKITCPYMVGGGQCHLQIEVRFILFSGIPFTLSLSFSYLFSN